MAIRHNMNTLHVLDVSDFVDLFESVMPEGVGVEEYLEAATKEGILPSPLPELSLMSLNDAFHVILDGLSQSKQEVASNRYQEIWDELQDTYDVESEVFVIVYG